MRTVEFKKNLNIAHIYENYLVELLGIQSYTEAPRDEAFPFWDLLDDADWTTYEVKTDFKAGQSPSNGLCIELSSAGKPSGLSITTANKWMHFVVYADRCVLYDIPIPFLRAEVLRGYRQYHVGCGSLSCCVFLPKAVVERFIVGVYPKPVLPKTLC